MRFIALLTAAAFLAACASTAPSAPSAPSTTTSATPSASSRTAQLLERAGRDNAPTQSEIERALGAADITRRDGAGAALTYRLPNCALLLLFAADSRNTMRLTQANPGPRRAGEATPSLQQCAAEADARGS